ncbi:unnamed protein product [Lampetra fluviatilis]
MDWAAWATGAAGAGEGRALMRDMGRGAEATAATTATAERRAHATQAPSSSSPRRPPIPRIIGRDGSRQTLPLADQSPSPPPLICVAPTALGTRHCARSLHLCAGGRSGFCQDSRRIQQPPG